METSIPLNSQRMLSLDAFRGFTIAAMILVNNPGSWEHIFSPLEHAAWNGLTPTDLIFPFFLFAMGFSIHLSFRKRLQSGVSKTTLLNKIIWRSLKIFLLGILLNLFPYFDFTNLRVAGVLQRIAIVYLVCSLGYIYLAHNWRGLLIPVILILYWILICIVPTPGQGKAMMEPGINMAAWIDQKLLPGNMWQGTWDPEGILSTLPAICSGLIGLIMAEGISKIESLVERINHLMVLGFILFVAGIIWSWFFPLNKNLWTSSYVLVTAGLASMFLGLCILLFDRSRLHPIGRFGIVFGENAILLYVLSAVIGWLVSSVDFFGNTFYGYILKGLTGMGTNPEFSSLVCALILIFILYWPARWLYRKKILIRL